MTDMTIPGPKWIPAFLEALARTRQVKKACAFAKVHDSTAFKQRRRNGQFSDAWQAALSGQLRAEDIAVIASGGPAASDNGGWKKPFLAKLAETSNIKTSAKEANVPLSTVYSTRARCADFTREWEAALFEGYTNLEMEVLGYLRNTKPDYKMDVANALRLLAAHKETVTREKSRRIKQDKASVLASLNAKLDKMRERKAAAAKLLAEDLPGAAPHDRN